jgi:hypothetical protein
MFAACNRNFWLLLHGIFCWVSRACRKCNVRAMPSRAFACLASLLLKPSELRIQRGNSVLVGRARELEQLHRELLEKRLVVISGGPGEGKTRLALELVTCRGFRQALSFFIDLSGAGLHAWHSGGAAQMKKCLE